MTHTAFRTIRIKMVQRRRNTKLTFLVCIKMGKPVFLFFKCYEFMGKLRSTFMIQDLMYD